MAETDINTKNGDAGENESSLIDPIYRKFSGSILRALGSTDFYEFFMDAISRANNTIQFSNRREIKTIDPVWIEAVEDVIEHIQQIMNSPRSVISEEEIIVNVANAKRTGADVVRHIAQHASLVENYDAATGDVKPSRVMQKIREDSSDLYENRVVYTTLERAYHFVKIRHDALCAAMSDEFGAKLKVKSDMCTSTEQVHFDMFVQIKDIDSLVKTDEKNRNMFERISRLYRLLTMFMNTNFAQELKKLPKINGKITKTNVLKRNPDYRAVVKLYEFFQSYDDIGYTIRVVEQNPQISDTFQRDVLHNVMFNYIILKGYLEDEADRKSPENEKKKGRKLKPKFIRQIIEELTEDYDLPDVEIRKVLIEELTKEQLMQEEEAERLRLVEEAEKRKREQEEQIRLEQEAEEERIRLEKEREEERREQEEEKRRAEDRRRGRVFRQELEYFINHLSERIESRQALEDKRNEHAAALTDFAEAVQKMEAEEQRRLDEAKQERIRRREERRRIKQERLLAEREEAERLERIRQLEEAERQRLLAEQRRADMELLRDYVSELERFKSSISARLDMREKQKSDIELRKLQRSIAKERRSQAVK